MEYKGWYSFYVPIINHLRRLGVEIGELDRDEVEDIASKLDISENVYYFLRGVYDYILHPESDLASECLKDLKIIRYRYDRTKETLSEEDKIKAEKLLRNLETIWDNLYLCI